MRCEHVSADGVRCRNHARPGLRFCGIHADEETEDESANDEGDLLI